MCRICIWPCWTVMARSGPRCGGGLLHDVGAEDLGIGAAQVVAVEQSQSTAAPAIRRASPRRSASDGQRRRDAGRVACPARRPPESPRRSSSQTATRSGAGSIAASSSRPGEKLGRRRAAMRSSRRKTSPRCASSAARRHTGFARKHFEPRERDDRNSVALGQAFDRAQRHAHAGKAARAVDDDDAAEVAELDAGRLQQIRRLRETSVAE